jgi:hypothetical protein
MGYFRTHYLDNITSNGKVIDEWLIGRCLDGSGLGLIQTWNFPTRTNVKYKNPVWIDDVPIGLRIMYFANTSPVTAEPACSVWVPYYVCQLVYRHIHTHRLFYNNIVNYNCGNVRVLCMIHNCTASRPTLGSPASYPVGTGGKTAEAWSWPLTSIYCRGQEMWSYTSTPPYIFMAYCVK